MRYVFATILLCLAACTPWGSASVPETRSAHTALNALQATHVTNLARHAIAAALFVATGNVTSTITAYDHDRNVLQRFTAPRGMIVRGGMHVDSAGTLYAVAAYSGPGGSDEQADVYEFGAAPYARPALVGVASTALVQNPVALCSTSPGSIYVVNEGIGKREKAFGWNTRSILLRDPVSGWAQTNLPNKEQMLENVGSGQDSFGDCFFPATYGVDEFTGDAHVAHRVRYHGSAMTFGQPHRAIAVGPELLYVGAAREIQVSAIPGAGAQPVPSYVIPHPWPEVLQHVGGLFARLATDAAGTLYVAHAKFHRCDGSKACYWVGNIEKYHPNATRPFQKVRFPNACIPGGQCLIDWTVASDGGMYIQNGTQGVEVFAPGGAEPTGTITTEKTITDLYAP